MSVQNIIIYHWVRLG